MQTGENTQGLRKVADLMRVMSFVTLSIHFYWFCYAFFWKRGWTGTLANRLMAKLVVPVVGEQELWKLKGAALLMLVVSLWGIQGKKDEAIKTRTGILYLLTGLGIYGSSSLWSKNIWYMMMTTLGYLLVLAGATLLTRLLKVTLASDIFNTNARSFPQEERLLENEYSVNLKSSYLYQGKFRNSWINIINPFRSTLVIGSGGAGKTYFVIRQIIEQHIQKGFSMLLFDFKFDDLSKIAYNNLLRHAKNYSVKPSFWVIDFDRIHHRCNPLYPESMRDITDAAESARTTMLGLNREWIKKQGDFFVESSINFVTAVIWFLRKYQHGKFCTLPHAIELIQAPYDQLFGLLESEPEVEALINPFISAWKNQAYDQLEGQIASAKIGLARLSSPQLYYVLSGNDFTLDINNPQAPKIVCLGSNPQKQQVYSPVLSLYISRIIKLVNRKDQLKSSLIFDEFPTIYFNGMDNLIATARSNKVATTLAVQDYSQLKKDYGREQAEVILNIVGNVISGQTSGDTAKHLSERFGKIMQQRDSISINSQDTSVSKSVQLDEVIPPSVIATLSSGEFVGMVADEPQEKIALKIFHNEIVNDHEAIARERAQWKDIPSPRQVSPAEISANYYRIKADIVDILYLCG